MAEQSPKRRWIFWLVVALAFVGAVAGLRTRVAWDEACTLARRQLPALLDAEVGIGRCELDPLTQSVRMYGVSAYRKGAERPLLAVDSLEVKLASVQPFFGTVELSLLRMERPRIHLDLASPPPPADPKAAKKDGEGNGGKGVCPLDAFRRVEIHKLALTGAQLHVSLPEGRTLELDGLDASWRTRRGVTELTVDVREGFVTTSARGKPLSISRGAIEGELDVEGETLSLAKAELDVDDITLSVNGKLEELCSPRLLLDVQAFLPLKTLARATGASQPMSGHAWTRVQLSGTAKEPTAAIDVVASGIEVGRYRPGDFNATATLAGKELRIGEVTFAAGPGTLKASARVGLSYPHSLSIQASAEDAELGPVLERIGMPGAWVNFLATGAGSASGQLRPSLELTGEASLSVSDFTIASRAFDRPASEGRTMIEFDRGSLKTPVRILADRVELPALEITTGNSSLGGSATLFYKPEDGLEVRAKASLLDLSDFGHVSELPWSGKGSADFHVRGPYRNVAIDGGLALTDFKFWDFALGVVEGKLSYRDRKLTFPAITGQKGATQYTGNAELGFNKKETETRAHVEIASARKPGRVQDVVDMIVGLHSSIDLFQGPLVGAAHGVVDISGPASRFAGGVILTLSNVTYYDRALGDGEAKLQFIDGKTLRLDSFDLKGSAGSLSGIGAWEFAGPLDFEFRGTGLSLSELASPARTRVEGEERREIAGVGKFRFTLGGSTQAIIVGSGEVATTDIVVDGRHLGPAHMGVDLKERTLTLTGNQNTPFLPGVTGTAVLTLKAPVPYVANLGVRLDDLRNLMGSQVSATGLSGAVHGDVIVTGTLSGDPTADVDATLSRVTVARGDLRAENDGPVHLTYSGGTLVLDPFRVTGPTTRLAGAGTLGAGKLDARLEGTLDVRLLETFVGSVERTSGTIDLTLAATGRPDRPVLVGGARIRDAGLSLRDRPVTLRALSGDVEFSDQRVVLEDVNGILNDGRMSLHGNILVDRGGIKHLSLTTNIENVFYRVSEDLPLTASGQVELTGSLQKYLSDSGEPLNVSGSLAISKVRYERPLVLDTFVKDIGRTRIYYGAEKTPREWLYFRDLGVTLDDVRIDNNLAKAKLVGRLKVTGTNAKTGLIGVVETAREGSQAFFRGNTLDLSQGTIEFRSRESIESVFDLHANTRVRDYELRIHAFGRTSDPKVIMSAEPSLPEGDIISLLTFGVTSRDRNENASVAATYIAADAFLAASGLDRQVQRFLPKNDILRNPQVHIATGFNESSGQVEPLASLESRLLWQELKLGMTRPFSGRGTRVNLEWQFENGLSAQGQWDENSEAQSPFGNVGLDLKMRWEVE